MSDQSKKHDHKEKYTTTLYHNYDTIHKITILGDNIYIYHVDYMYIQNININFIKLPKIGTPETVESILNYKIDEFLKENDKSFCSGYYPSNDESIQNFYDKVIKNDEIKTTAYSKGNIFTYSSKDHKINIFDKKTKELIHTINNDFLYKQTRIIRKLRRNWFKNIFLPERMSKSYNHDLNFRYYRNIITYDNILYIIEYFWYTETITQYKIITRRNDDLGGCYVRMYNIETFEFIREFTKRNEYTYKSFPVYMVVTVNKIAIYLSTGDIEIWDISDRS
jgi:hypothetical protein